MNLYEFLNKDWNLNSQALTILLEGVKTASFVSGGRDYSGYEIVETLNKIENNIKTLEKLREDYLSFIEGKIK